MRGGDATIICWTRVKNSTAEWRTLSRSLSNGSSDHHVIIESGGWNIGMYDGTLGTGFQNSGFSQQSLPNYGTSNWVMICWRFSSSTPHYRISYNDTPGTIRGSISNNVASFKGSICSIGAYNNGNQTDPATASQYWGDIGMIAVYTRQLTDEEVLQCYNAGSPRFMSATQTYENIVTFNDGTTQLAKSPTLDKGALISITSFTGNGTYYVPANCSKLYVKVQGGGGGSAGYLESGGAGGYAEGSVSNITAGQAISVTIGGGGGGVGYYAAAGAGGTSSFGSYVSASGGSGANSNYSHTGGHGGVGSGGTINLYGGGGTGHGNHHGYGGVGQGGASFFGGSHGTRHYHSDQNGPGSPGAGASGGCTDGFGTTGRTGASGLVVVYAYT